MRFRKFQFLKAFGGRDFDSPHIPTGPRGGDLGSGKKGKTNIEFFCEENKNSEFCVCVCVLMGRGEVWRRGRKRELFT